jgi:protein-L-isoaspartate(D-aspartate) O-methyltransferase
MVETQLRRRGIADERVLAAMEKVPREEFVPERTRHKAYEDGALSIGYGQTISQPWVVAAICQALELSGGERVLDVGGGAGYATAVIAQLVQPGGSVVSYELVPELAERARGTLARLGYSNVSALVGDGASPREGPWDAIAVHAAAPNIPGSLAAALVPGGRLAIPLAQGRSDVLTRCRRTDDGGADATLESEPIADCRFVPLLGESGFESRDR